MTINYKEPEVKEIIINIFIMLIIAILFVIISLYSPFLPNLKVTLIVLSIGLFIESLIKTTYLYLSYTKIKRPSKLKPEINNAYKRAWEYHKAADSIYQGRIHFLLVAESMLLLSFVTFFSKYNNTESIPSAIAFVGILLTLSWYYINIRQAIRTTMLKDRYLIKNDPVYWDYIKSVAHSPTADFLLSVFVPASITLLWVYLFFISLGNPLNLFLKILLPITIIALMVLRLIVKYIFPTDKWKK